MTAPEQPSGGLDSNLRGFLVLGAAVVVGIVLLASVGSGGSTTLASGSGDTSTTIDVTNLDDTGTSTPEQATTTTTDAAGGSDRSPSEVSVIVLNGSGQTGAAGTISTTLGGSGYTMLTPGNAASAETTVVFYAEDYEADAIAVAELLGKGTDAVKPLSDASLGGAEGDADVAVVLGADTPPVSGSSTTTTAAG